MELKAETYVVGRERCKSHILAVFDNGSAPTMYVHVHIRRIMQTELLTRGYDD